MAGRTGGDVREVKETALRYQLLQACLPAALLALEDVNNNQDILTNYHINLAAKDDEVRDLSLSLITNYHYYYLSVTVGSGPTDSTSSSTRRKTRKWAISILVS